MRLPNTAFLSLWTRAVPILNSHSYQSQVSIVTIGEGKKLTIWQLLDSGFVNLRPNELTLLFGPVWFLRSSNTSESRDRKLLRTDSWSFHDPSNLLTSVLLRGLCIWVMASTLARSGKIPQNSPQYFSFYCLKTNFSLLFSFKSISWISLIRQLDFYHGMPGRLHGCLWLQLPTDHWLLQ